MRDLVIAAVGLVAVALVLLVVGITTDNGEVTDPSELRALLPPWLLAVTAGAANLVVIVLAGVTSVERILHQEYRPVIRGLAAATLGYALTGAVNASILAISGPGGPPEALASPGAYSAFTNPLHAYLAAAIGYVGALPLGHLPRIRTAMWSGIAVTGAAVLLAGLNTSLSLLLTALVGATSAAAASFALGLSRPAPATGRLIRELRRFGHDPLGLTPGGTDAEGNQLFEVDTVDRRLDVVLMRADDLVGFWRHLFRIVLLRDPAAPPVLLGPRRRAEHTALMSFAANSAGAAAPRVLGIGELGGGTLALVREHVRTSSLDDAAADELTDEVLDDIWSELDLLHRHRIVHGNINGATVGWRLGGRVVFTGMTGGSLGAVGLKASLDVAALLAVLALRVGERRAVASAVRVLGVDPVAAALPLLQPAGMPRLLRRRLADHGDLLGRLRTQITGIAPEAPARPARLERMRPRTVVSVVAATIVGIVLAYQLADVDFSTVQGADLRWAAAAFAASTVCMLAAALVIMAFVPVRLRFWMTVLVQYAGAFIRIAAPAGLGTLALNTRYATQWGASAGLAISGIGLSQAVGVVLHVAILLVAAYLTGTGHVADFSPSSTLIVVTAGLSVVVAAVLLVPALRRAVHDRIRPYFRGVLPQLLDLLQSPRRMAMGIGGTLLLTAAYVLCLYFSVTAFGGTADLAAVAVVFLAGNAIGSAAPTPGGLGAVEAALLGGLTAVAGVPAAIGLPAVLLFRALTFWLPVLPGWGAFHLLQRWKAI
nr:lysylphosphatidylglycerol synthase transmembrane domain-containing protein [Nocardiopsis mwathae]